ncbi:shufflon-specific DNA recombinase [Escherichia coli]|nr:shufflon-specific DNA recombinase [Escherichia coli]
MPSPRIRKMSLSRALDKYLKTVSVHKKGHQQEFYRSNVIKRYPIALRNMDEITTVDIGVSLDIENYCTLSSFFIISGFFGNVIFWMLRRSCGDIEHR